MASFDSEQLRVFTRRAVLLGGLKTSLLSLLLGRLYYLEIIEGDAYRTLAEENRINLRLIAPRRGLILDHYGTALAANQQNYRAVILPEQISDLEKTLEQISHYISITESDRHRIYRDINNENNFNAVPVRDNLTWEQVASLSVHSLDLPGVDIDTGDVRSYPFGETTSHVLGYVGTVGKDESDDDEDTNNDVLSIPYFRIGKIGIEKQYDTELRGEAGNEQMEVNAHGRVVRELARSNPRAGKDITLTLDIGLQQFVQQRLLRELSAAVVVMDVHQGDILALVSQPGFDPNIFAYGISQDDWQTLNQDEHTPLLNKAISGQYAPGSTIKPLIALAALEANMLDPQAEVYCPGFYELGSSRFHCWKHSGHGNVNMISAFAGSCDTYFYDLGHRVGIDRIQSMGKRFGLGHKTGIDLPHERMGIMPGRAWKLATQGGLWQQGETLNTAIGQGYSLATPVQLAMMVARLVNGGRAVAPHLIKRINDQERFSQEPPSLGLEAHNLMIVRQAMAAVVNSPLGTAYAARIQDPLMSMGGKTGTAQVRHISEMERSEGVIINEDLPWKQRDHALFVGYAPLANPKFAISVLIEHGGSGAHTAAPVAKDILIEAQSRSAGHDERSPQKK